MRTPGALGCGLSHIKALTEAQSHSEWNTIMIVEDDFTFRSSSKERINDSLRILLSFIKEDSCGLLASNHHDSKANPTYHSNIQKMLYSQTTSGYIIRKSYLSTLLQNMKEAMYDMERFGWSPKNCIDVYWSRLQQKDNWYCYFPIIGYQYDSYSDIEYRIVAYGC